MAVEKGDTCSSNETTERYRIKNKSKSNLTNYRALSHQKQEQFESNETTERYRVKNKSKSNLTKLQIVIWDKYPV
ncbi:hypothetical protein PAJ34TS1_10290 [Paenibacillus azoreducens]